MFAWIILAAIVIGLTIYIKHLKTTPLDKTHQPKQLNWLNLAPQEFVVIDFETSGLDPTKHQIIEVGALLVRREQLAEETPTLTTFHSLIKAKRKLPKKIVDLTGIDDDLLAREGRELGDAVKDLVEFIGDRPLVAFNAPFDQGFLLAAAEKHGIQLNNRWICVLKKARATWPGRKSYKLSELTKANDLPNAHRALADSYRALIVYASALKH